MNRKLKTLMPILTIPLTPTPSKSLTKKSFNLIDLISKVKINLRNPKSKVSTWSVIKMEIRSQRWLLKTTLKRRWVKSNPSQMLLIRSETSH